MTRSKLTKVIKRNEQCWTELLGVVDEDPCGRLYKVVNSRLMNQSRQQPTFSEQLKNIVSTLFLEQEPFNYQVKQETEHIPPIIREELRRENKRIGDSNAPGVDNILNVAWKAAVNATPEVFLNMYNRCLAEGTFPKRWKQRRLVFLPKGNIVHARFIRENARTFHFQSDRGRYSTFPSRQPVQFQKGKIVTRRWE